MSQNLVAFIAKAYAGGAALLNLDASGNLLVALAASPEGPLPVTEANGANVALGSTTDAADSTAANGTVVGLLKGLLRSQNQSYATVAASQTKAVLGATGAVGDTLASLIIVPATTSPGAVTLFDGSGSSGITLFTGGATSVADLKPINVPVNARSKTSATPGWFVSTGANVSVLAIGNFT